jgi:hypothetical protein
MNKHPAWLNPLLILAGWLLTVWVIASCGSSMTPGVFATFDGGTIDLGSSSSDVCKMTVSGSTSLNSSTYTHPGKGDCGLETSGDGVDTMTLPTFLTSTSSVDVTIQNSAYIKIGNTAYQPTNGSWCKNSSTCYSGSAGITLPSINSSTQPYVLFDNASASQFDQLTSEVSNYPFYFKYSPAGSAYRVNSITLKNSSVLILEPGDYYIGTLISSGTFYIRVNAFDSSGKALGDGTGKVKLYLYNSPETKFENGNGSCINIINCGATITSTDGEYPQRLQIWVYKNSLKLPYTQGSIQVAASIYVAEGDLVFNTNSGSTFIGEAVAENVSVYNEPVYLVYEDTGAFASLYSTSSSIMEGEYSLASSVSPAVTSTGDLMYIPYQTDYYQKDDGSYSWISGHLKAFAYQSDGSVSSTASWDADDEMTVSDRQSKLWSTDNNGNLVLFASLDDNAFSSTGTPSVSDIIAYTLDPSYHSGAYLANRDPDGMIGRPNTSQPGILGNLVVFQTDDGFLYAVDATSGALKWGYIPRPLVASLKNYSSFFTTHPMNGQIAVLNLDNDSGSTAGYVVGSADSGAIHYALSVDRNGNLDDLLWLDSTSGSNPHRPIVFYIGSTPYAVYVGGTEEVVIRSLASNYSETRYDVSQYLDAGATLTAAPIGVADYALNSAGTSRYLNLTLFVGDSVGDVYYGTLISSNSIGSHLKLTALGNIGSSSTVSDPVKYIEHATKGSTGYITVQSTTRLKTFRYPESDASWFANWTSYTGGSGYWNDTGSGYTAETTFTPKSEHIQKLPDSGATITDKLSIASGVVFLPVQVESSGSCTASYYLYKLENGVFPTNTTFVGVTVTDNITLGTGNAYTPIFTVLNGEVTGTGLSEQMTSGGGGPIRFSNGPGGRSGWRELRNE